MSVIVYSNTLVIGDVLDAGTIELDSTTNNSASIASVTAPSGGFGTIIRGWRRSFSVVFRTIAGATGDDLEDTGIPSNSLVTYERFAQDEAGTIVFSNAVLAPIGPLTIESEIQNLSISAFVEMFEVDTTVLGGSLFYFHAGTNELREAVVWQGIEYQPFPVEASGFERSGTGTSPQPKLRVANVTSLISALCATYDDLVGAKVTRRRTLLKYLDAVNFAGGVNTTADPTAHFPDEIWYVNRKADENSVYVDFDLASASDVSSVMIPRGQIIANTCRWLAIGGYRGPFCGYAGGAVSDANDVPTSDLASDDCGGRIKSCKLRFGEFAQLPYGGFPGAGLVR